MSEATQQLEAQLKAEKELIELSEVAQRLHNNKDFRRLIDEEYLSKEPARLAMISGDPILPKDEREDAIRMAQAAGHFKRFMSVTFQRGAIARSNIVQIENELEELRIEEAQD